MASPLQFVAVERAGHVATVTIQRPDKLNALNPAVLGELTAAFQELLTPAEGNEVRAAVLTGAGKAFAAGADIAEMAAMNSIAGWVSPTFDSIVELSFWGHEIKGRLAFVGKSGSEYLAVIDGKVVEAPGGVYGREIRFSEDGDHLAFVSRVRGATGKSEDDRYYAIWDGRAFPLIGAGNLARFLGERPIFSVSGPAYPEETYYVVRLPALEIDRRGDRPAEHRDEVGVRHAELAEEIIAPFEVRLNDRKARRALLERVALRRFGRVRIEERVEDALVELGPDEAEPLLEPRALDARG